MRSTPTARALRASPRARRSRQRAQPVPLFAVVDGDKIPPRCYDEPLSVAAADPRCAKAYDALCESLSRGRKVGITTVEVDGSPRLAALVPIGRVLAVSPLRRDYTAAFADGLRSGARPRRSRARDRECDERRAAA
jgi:hypothetical protein